MTMDARVNIVTLGVADLKRGRRFYEQGLGWRASSASQGDIVFFQLAGVVLALYPADSLAEDATVAKVAGGGFRGITLAQNVREKAKVAEILNIAQAAGGTIVKPAQDVFWGGHSGYFADPDGHVWEIAWNPHFKLNPRGELELPMP
jgi:hypothetical protein